MIVILLISAILLLLYLYYRAKCAFHQQKNQYVQLRDYIAALNINITHIPTNSATTDAITSPLFAKQQQQLIDGGENYSATALQDKKLLISQGKIWRGEIIISDAQYDMQKLGYLAYLEHFSDPVAIMHKNELIYCNQSYRKAFARLKAPISTIEKNFSLVVGQQLRYFSAQQYELQNDYFLQILRDESKLQDLNRKLARQKEGYTKTFDYLSCGITLFDINQQLIFYNQAFAELFKLDLSFLDSGPTHSDLLYQLREQNILMKRPDWQQWCREHLRIYKSLEVAQEKWHLPDGTIIRLMLHPQPQGGICAIFENITEHIKLESRYNSLNQLQGAILDNLQEGVALIDSSGKIILSNPAFANLWQAQDAIIQSMHIGSFFEKYKNLLSNEQYNQILHNILGCNDSGDEKRGKLTLLNGRILQYLIWTVVSGNKMLVFADITDHMLAQEALREKNEALLATDKLRTEFVRHMAHELRSPLMSILGFSDLLREGNNKFSKRSTEYLDYIDNEAKKLQNIVQDLLDLASLNADLIKLEFEDIALEAIIEQVWQKHESQLGANQIALKWHIADPLRIIYSDKQRIIQLLDKMISYLAMHAKHQETIYLEIEQIEQIQQYLRFSFTLHDIEDLEKAKNEPIELALAKNICKLFSGNFSYYYDNNAAKFECDIKLEVKDERRD